MSGWIGRAGDARSLFVVPLCLPGSASPIFFAGVRDTSMLVVAVYTALEAFSLVIVLCYTLYATIGFATNYRFFPVRRRRRVVVIPPPPLG